MGKARMFKLIVIIPIFIACLFNNSNNSTTSKILKECGATTADYLGPYYIANIPEKVDLLEPKLKGQEIVIKGKVFDYNTLTPIAEVVVDIWHSDAEGNYWPENNGDYKNYKEEEVKFRGKAITDKEGNFSFKTILPGKYGGRPIRHYHFKIMHQDYKDLITQIYYQEDRKLVDNYGASKVESCRLFSVNDKEEINVNLLLE